MVTFILGIIYLSFISLGLPSNLLGAAWEPMRADFGVNLAAASPISMTINLCIVITSLACEKILQKIKIQHVLCIATLFISVSLLGFSLAPHYMWLIIFAIPLGLASGIIDTGLNNYVALHYKSRHLSWLHCFWGVGAIAGPLFISFSLDRYNDWRGGYRFSGILQLALFVLLVIILPLWKKMPKLAFEKDTQTSLSQKSLSQIPGIGLAATVSFLYCGVEQGLGLWAASYFIECLGVSPSVAARWSSYVFIGLTVGRFINGFLTYKFNNKQLIRLGVGIMLLGSILFALPLPWYFSITGVILAGVGCAPIMPCIVHETPRRFGVERSQQIVGIQLASSYAGTFLLPPLIGILAQYSIGIKILPWSIIVLALLMALAFELLNRKTQPNHKA